MTNQRVPMYPRDGGGSFKLPSTKEGAIQRMVHLGDFMEVYTPEESFKVQTPESVDPARTNANAMWVVAKVADVGSASPIVARTIIQAHDILRDRMVLKDDARIAVHKLMHKIKNSLLQCELAQDIYLESEHKAGDLFSSTDQPANEKAYKNFPVVPAIDEKITNFLTPARRVVTDVLQVPGFFWDLKRQHSTLDNLITKELIPLLGRDHRMVDFFTSIVPDISRIVNFRNGQEHVSTTKGTPLVIRNFFLLPTNEVHVPIWNLEDEQPTSIVDELPIMLNNLLIFAETMLIACIESNLPDFPPMLMQQIEVPKPLCPVKYQLVVDASKFQLRTNKT
ncbi:hypothetical protein [Janthinobacterium sp. HLX7-2]|uniref:hypothetical protein n=1 Tax=Janthinobacterium sp. HLX7-2 TaxID=1259331 RepID=UPI003F27623B